MAIAFWGLVLVEYVFRTVCHVIMFFFLNQDTQSLVEIPEELEETYLLAHASCNFGGVSTFPKTCETEARGPSTVLD